MEITYKYVTPTIKERVELVLCALPALWAPDAALYYLEDLNVYVMAMISTEH